ncbi:histone methyltransferase set2 [Geranomyces variabilis]|nr:histone methyltransferase set2 [Geranomyces variabilis]
MADHAAFPSNVQDVAYGQALCASSDLEAGTVVEHFEGEIVDYDQLSDYDKTYVLNFLPKGSEDWIWMLPRSNARFANHSCDPNAFICSDTLDLVLRRAVKKDEQITFLYNQGADSDYWDPVWNFKCCCGAAQCQGLIDRYRDSNLVHPPRIAKLFTLPSNREE